MDDGCITDVYAKYGSITDTCGVSARIHVLDVVSLTNIISVVLWIDYENRPSYCSRRWRSGGFSPFCYFPACSHGGPVEEVLCYFHTMDTYGVTPRMKHYASSSDLLGRASCPDDAAWIYEENTHRIDKLICKSFVGATRIRGNIELGKTAAEKLISVTLLDWRILLLMSFCLITYMLSGKLECGLVLGNVMKGQDVKEGPGFRFYARDQEHP